MSGFGQCSCVLQVELSAFMSQTLRHPVPRPRDIGYWYFICIRHDSWCYCSPLSYLLPFIFCSSSGKMFPFLTFRMGNQTHVYQTAFFLLFCALLVDRRVSLPNVVWGNQTHVWMQVFVRHAVIALLVFSKASWVILKRLFSSYGYMVSTVGFALPCVCSLVAVFSLYCCAFFLLYLPFGYFIH